MGLASQMAYLCLKEETEISRVGDYKPLGQLAINFSSISIFTRLNFFES